MNEADTNSLAIQRLVNSAIDLHLTNPTNPYTGSSATFSSATPTERIDYIMPCGPLSSNVTDSQVFRTRLLSPLPPNLNGNDDQMASDHLPVVMTFNNFYTPPITATNGAPQTNSAPPGSITYYQVNVPVNADFATNTLLFTTNGTLNIWFTTNAPPTIAGANDYLLLTNATSGSVVLGTNSLPALVPGSTYYLGIENTNSVSVGYAIEVDFHLVLSAKYDFALLHFQRHADNQRFSARLACANQLHLPSAMDAKPVSNELEDV